MKIKKYNLICWEIISLAGICSSLLTMVFASTTEQFIMSFLPVTYILSITLSGVFRDLINSATPGMMLVNGLYFIKCVVYPLVNVISENTYTIGNNITNYAILLEIGEIVVIYLVFFLWEKFQTKGIRTNKPYSEMQNHINNGKFIIFCFLILTIIIIIAFPNALKSYNFFTVESLEIIQDGLSASDESGIVTLIIKLARYILVAYFFGWFYCKYRQTQKSRYILGALCLVIISTMIVRGVSRSDFVIPGLCGYFLLIRLFPKQLKIITFSLLGCMAFVFITFTLMRYGEITSLKEMSATLQAYFCCEKNMSIAIISRDIYEREIGIKTLLSDLLGNWAGVGGLFRDNYNITEYFNFTFHGHRFAVDQIVPTIGQGYMQFGFFGTYIYTIIMCIMCKSFDKKYRDSDKVEFSYLYLYGAIKCVVTLMGNFKIYSATLFNVLLPIWLLFCVNQKIAIKRRG